MTVLETFEGTEAGWAVSRDTSGTGSIVERSSAQAHAGTYSAHCFSTNSGAKAQIRVSASSPWSGVPSAYPGEFIWQRAFVYIPSATANAITGSEYIDIAGFYLSSNGSGWLLRMKENAAMYAEGQYFGAHEFRLYGAFPLDEWFELEIGLWSQNIEACGRSFIVFINGKCHGWYNLGSSGDDIDYCAAGIIDTTSADDLDIYIDDWDVQTSDIVPNGSDNRPSGNYTKIDYRLLDGENLSIHYHTWQNSTNPYLDADHGVGGFRFQTGPNVDLQKAILDSGWIIIEIDWTGGVQPTYPPDELWGTYFFAVMPAFKKYMADEENLEIVFLYDYGGSGTVELVYESWVTGLNVLSSWEIPTASVGGKIPEPGDKIFVRWENLDDTYLRVMVDYYDASADTWYNRVIDDTRDMTNEQSVNWFDGKHNEIGNTIETDAYTIRYMKYGTLETAPRKRLTQNQSGTTVGGVTSTAYVEVDTDVLGGEDDVD